MHYFQGGSDFVVINRLLNSFKIFLEQFMHIPPFLLFLVYTSLRAHLSKFITNWTRLNNSLLEVRQQFDSKLPIMWSQLGKMTLYFLGIYAAAQLGARGVVTPIG
jgi:hypothetical protein